MKRLEWVSCLFSVDNNSPFSNVRMFQEAILASYLNLMHSLMRRTRQSVLICLALLMQITILGVQLILLR